MKRMSEQTINAIINYLVQQPYKDVAWTVTDGTAGFTN